MEHKLSFHSVPRTQAAAAVAPGAVLWGCRLQVRPRAGALPAVDLDASWSELAPRWSGKTRQNLREDPIAEAYCRFYRQLGINPKDHPPSAMNLVQRFLLPFRTGRVRSINALVDAGNIASASTLVPVALLDASRLEGDLQLDVSRPCDVFRGFGMDADEPVAAGTVVLRDAVKVVSLFCYRDGQATAVTEQTTSLHMLACQVDGVETAHVQSALERTASLLGRRFDLVL